jgi:hypothetical protein
MHIGIDFDNTIVSYDALFHRVALETRLIPQSLPANKAAVRNHLRNKGLEDTWTEMQGYVYGARMNEAAVYPGFSEFVLWARSAGHTTSIVSHKTRHPFAGPPYDLHGAARAWINTHLLHDGRPLFAEDCIFFELTKQQKLARIKTIACDAFIDDLPEILLADGMPPRIRKLLFDPDANHAPPGHHDLVPVTSWADVHDVLDA